jgi:hypothetical protein
MSYASELDTNKKNTVAFIEANPIELSLTPSGWIETESGGRVRSDLPPRPAQVFRLVDQSTAFFGNSPGLVTTSDGQQRKATHQLLGAYDAVMAVDDWWVLDGVRYEITEVLTFNGYERRGRVTRFA